jgi:hypothetical protein
MAALVTSDEFTQGSVLDDLPWDRSDKPLGIVLTNPCDLQWEKAAYVVVAALLPARDVIHASNDVRAITDNADEQQALSKTKWATLEKRLEKYVYNADITRFFLITAEVLELPPLLIDFQDVLSVPFDEVPKSVLAVLPSPYREKMIVHYASYVSRIAVDRVEGAELDGITRELAAPFRAPP